MKAFWGCYGASAVLLAAVTFVPYLSHLLSAPFLGAGVLLILGTTLLVTKGSFLGRMTGLMSSHVGGLCLGAFVGLLIRGFVRHSTHDLVASVKWAAGALIFTVAFLTFADTPDPGAMPNFASLYLNLARKATDPDDQRKLYQEYHRSKRDRVMDWLSLPAVAVGKVLLIAGCIATLGCIGLTLMLTHRI